MTRGTFHSASGLRPTTAFFGVGIVLVVVLVRSAGLCIDGDCRQPDQHDRESLPAPDFDIADRGGRTLARSVRRLDLELSPRSIWQAHTPDHMARGISDALGGVPSPEELLDRMLPDAVDGVIRAEGALRGLDFDAARRVRAWLRDAALDTIWIEREAAPGRFGLAWRPVETLSHETRARVLDGQRDPSPLRWTRRLTAELARCLQPGPAEGEDPEDAPRPDADARKAVWDALMPAGHAVVLEGIPAERALALHALLDAEGVHDHQMNLRFVPERRYPVRESGADANSFEILGSWRYIAEPEALAMAAAERGLRGPEDCPEELRAGLRRRTAALLECKHPRSGLEGLSAALLASPAYADLRPVAASYRFRFDRPVHHPARRYYVADALETDTPRVITTLDASLQTFVRGVLEDVIAEHDPALAMAIAVELDTGEVLAVDGISQYETAEFLPTWHLFTPGSTFKAIVMAAALDAGAVTPDERFDTHDGHYAIPSSSRVIREAEGPPGGWRTATEGLAHSINAVLVQIGTRVPAERLRGALVAMGYGLAPGTGLGVERAGTVPSLPWKPAWKHASVSFGHQLAVSLWQHATGLATVLRGGVHLPLRVVTAIECDGQRRDVPPPAGQRVFGRQACEDVRHMMVLGAHVGTGRRLWARELEASTPLALATKTGTAEKVPTEPCLHLELARNQHNRRLERDDPAWVPFTALRGQPRPHRRSCYTSSICALGSVPGEGREVMVLVVVDEARGKSKYGSDVAGPAAIAILKEALGITEGGETLGGDAAYVPPIDYSHELNGLERPWYEDGAPAAAGEPR